MSNDDIIVYSYMNISIVKIYFILNKLISTYIYFDCHKHVPTGREQKQTENIGHMERCGR
jgi:hypothetical protein